MPNIYRSGCGCRTSNNTFGALNSVARRCRDNYPFYDGCCPDAGGCYDCGPGWPGRPWGDGACYAMLSACQPLAVAANGNVPLAKAETRNPAFGVNGGVVSLYNPGVYLATMTVRVPAATAVDSTFALALNDVSLPTTITPVETTADDTQAFTATSQALFTAEAGDAVAIRSDDTVNLTDPAIEPMFVLTLVRLDG